MTTPSPLDAFRLDGRLRQDEPNHSRRDALTASVARTEELPA